MWMIADFLPADSQPKSIGLVWGLAATWGSVCIHHMNRVNSCNGATPRWQHHKYRRGNYYYYDYYFKTAIHLNSNTTKKQKWFVHAWIRNLSIGDKLNKKYSIRPDIWLDRECAVHCRLWRSPLDWKLSTCNIFIQQAMIYPSFPEYYLLIRNINNQLSGD